MATYKGIKKIKQLASTRDNYRRKNDAGGRLAVFSISSAYKRGWRYNQTWASGVTKLAREWGT